MAISNEVAIYAHLTEYFFLYAVGYLAAVWVVIYLYSSPRPVSGPLAVVMAWRNTVGGRRLAKAWETPTAASERKTSATGRLAQAFKEHGCDASRLSRLLGELPKNPFGEVPAPCNRKQRFKCWLKRTPCYRKNRPEPKEVDIRIERDPPGWAPLRDQDYEELEARAAYPAQLEQELAVLAGAIGKMAADTGIVLPSTSLRGPHLIRACEETTQQLERLSIGYEKLRRAILQDRPRAELRELAEELLP